MGSGGGEIPSRDIDALFQLIEKLLLKYEKTLMISHSSISDDTRNIDYLSFSRV